MSILDSVKNLAASELSKEAAKDPVLGHLLNLVNNPETGGLEGMIQKFHSNGLGGLVNSWLGSGPNQAVTADQIVRVIGQDRLNGIAQKLGMEPDKVSGLIAQHLPGVIDRLTPGGAQPKA
jgi:uncharacterized protein YidB (DUF937 family)